jgi:hypothetical protein
MTEPIFKLGDYIINRSAGDMAIVDKVTKKNYYHFKVYYGGMFHEFKNVSDKGYDLQVNYQKFFDLCNEEEKKILDELIKNKGSE